MSSHVQSLLLHKLYGYFGYVYEHQSAISFLQNNQRFQTGKKLSFISLSNTCTIYEMKINVRIS